MVLIGTGDNADLDGAQKTGGKIDAVVKAEQQALPGIDSQIAQHVCAAVGALRQFRVAVRSGLVEDSDPARAIWRQIAVEDIDRRVVVVKFHLVGFPAGFVRVILREAPAKGSRS